MQSNIIYMFHSRNTKTILLGQNIILMKITQQKNSCSGKVNQGDQVNLYIEVQKISAIPFLGDFLAITKMVLTETELG